MKNYTHTDTIYETTLQTINLRIGDEYRSRILRRYTIIKTPDDIHKILRIIFKTLDDGQSHGVLLILNNENRVTGYKVLSSGTRHSYTIDPTLVFRHAILLGASRIILAHNDTGESAKFLREDLDISEQLMRLGALHGIPVLDHIIMVHNGFRSLREYSRNFYRFIQDEIEAEKRVGGKYDA